MPMSGLFSSYSSTSMCQCSTFEGTRIFCFFDNCTSIVSPVKEKNYSMDVLSAKKSCFENGSKKLFHVFSLCSVILRTTNALSRILVEDFLGSGENDAVAVTFNPSVSLAKAVSLLVLQ